MSKYSSINKKLNQSQRLLDELARDLLSVENRVSKDDWLKVVKAIGLVNEVQKSIWHIDPNLSILNQDSDYLARYRGLLVRAADFESKNDLPRAIKELNTAIDMGLPAIMHEVVAKELKRIKNLS